MFSVQCAHIIYCDNGRTMDLVCTINLGIFPMEDLQRTERDLCVIVVFHVIFIIIYIYRLT